MTRWGSDPDAAAQALIASVMDECAVEPPLLWAGAGGLALPRTAVFWNRRFVASVPGRPEPPPGPFATAVLRLPKSRAEQVMTAHQCLGVLAPEGRLILYGGNDEGIRSLQNSMDELAPTLTRATRGHGRVFEMRRRDVAARLKPQIADWRYEATDPATGENSISYPGLFAGGGRDPGTALLLAHLPALPAGATSLDYGCGPGAISAELRRRHPDAKLTLLDDDSVALLAATENVPGATLIAGDSLAAAGARRFDLIVSNPPLHSGFKEDTTALLRLIADAPRYLTVNGVLLLVVQRRIPVERALAAAFRAAERLGDDGRFCVWLGSGVAIKSGRPQQAAAVPPSRPAS